MRLCLLALLASACAPALCQWDNDGVVFGAREIDKLPKSHYAEPLYGRSGWYYGDTEPVTEPTLSVHTKPSFRAAETPDAGAAAMQRLCVIEAALPEGRPRTGVLRFSCGERTWEETVNWLAPKPQFRPMWLPVSLRHTTVELLVEGRCVGQDEIATDEAAPACVFSVQVPGEPNYVDHGYGLLPADRVMAYPGQAVQVLAAVRPAGPGEATVKAWLTDAEGPARSFSLAVPGSGEMPASLTIDTRDLEPGTYRLVLEAALPHGETARAQRELLVVMPFRETGFSAYRTDLRYPAPVYTSKDDTRSWDELWRGLDLDDVVVRFGNGARFVFWRGTSYVPCFAYNNTWLSYEWFEAEPDSHGGIDCIEPIMDKECRFSRVSILSSTPARVVVHWRYGLTDFLGKVINDEWADEYYYLYPDAVGVRKLVAWFKSGWHENQEFLVLNRPGNAPHEALDPRAITFLTTDGRTQRPVWPSPYFDLKDWPHVIAKINIPGRPSPFMVVDDDRVDVKVWAQPYVDKPGLFNTYIHWPISRGIRTAWLDDPADWRRPTHSNLVNLVSDAAVRQADNSRWYWLIGQATREKDIREYAECWLRPAPIEVAGGASQGYDKFQRAYVIAAEPAAAEISITLRPQAPVVNPAFVIEGAPAAFSSVRCSLPDATAALGREDDGKRLVVWVEGRFDREFTLQVR